jgi:hypothetical protein
VEHCIQIIGRTPAIQAEIDLTRHRAYLLRPIRPLSRKKKFWPGRVNWKPRAGLMIRAYEESRRMIRMPTVADAFEQVRIVGEVIRYKQQNHQVGMKVLAVAFVEGKLIGLTSAGISERYGVELPAGKSLLKRADVNKV